MEGQVEKVEQGNKQQQEVAIEDDLADVTGSDVYVPAPKHKGVVQRCFHRKSTIGGHKKRITIFYEYDRYNKILRYGAVVVVLDKMTKKKRIEEFENSAKKRFIRAPVVIRDFKDIGTKQDMEDRIRKLLFTHGCKSK